MLTVNLDIENSILAALGRNMQSSVPLINAPTQNGALEIAALSIFHMRKACLWAFSSLLSLGYHFHRWSQTMKEAPKSHNVCSDIMPVSLGENREPSDQQVLQLDCQCCWARSNNLQHGNKHTADTEVIQSWESFFGIYVAKCPPAPQKKCSVRLVLCWLYRQLKLSLRGLLLFKTNKGGN